MPRAPTKKSTDPIQQALRDHKKDWNAQCSSIIGRLIALKRGINGKGDAKVGLPPSSIKEALPGEVNSLLGQLAGEFQELVGSAQGIVQEQASYSKNRRKPRPKGAPKGQPMPQQAAPNATPAPTEQVVENIGKMGSTNIELEALGSNPLTRAWAYLSSLFSGKEFRKERIGLLSIAANLYKHLLDLENHVLMLSKQSIPQSISKYQLAKYKFEALKRSFIRVEHLLLEKARKEAPQEEIFAPVPQEQPQQPQMPKEEADPVDEVSQMIVKLINDGADRKSLDPIINFIGDYETETNPRTKKMIANKIVKMFQKAVATIIQQKQMKPQANDNFDSLVKEATNPAGRWLRRQLVKALKFNRTAGPRLDAVEVLDDVKKNMKQFMDELEGDTSIEELGKMIVEIGKGIEEMGKPIGTLSLVFQEDFYSTQKNKKYDSWRGPKNRPPEYNDRFIDYILNRKMRRDLSRDLV
jgi:hypothetical protein